MTMFAVALGVAMYFLALGYISTNQIYIGLIAFLIVFLDMFLWIIPKLKKASNKRKRAQEAYFFIHQMIIGLSVHQSAQKAFKQVIEQKQPSFMTMLEHVEPMDGVETLKYLSRFFPLKIYDMFLHLVDIFTEQGTDILKSSELLREQLSSQETQLGKERVVQEKTLIENIILWIFSTLIVVACRYGIADFYLRMLENPLIVSGFCVYLAFVLLAVHQLADMYIQVHVVGWKDEIQQSD